MSAAELESEAAAVDGRLAALHDEIAALELRRRLLDEERGRRAARAEAESFPFDDESAHTDADDASVAWSDGDRPLSPPPPPPPPAPDARSTYGCPDEAKYLEWPDGVKQGSAGFNAVAAEQLRLADCACSDVRCTCAGGDAVRLQPYQRAVAYLVHPRSAVQRLLVYHQIGAGKTLSMIQVLDNFFADPRPKVVIFPTQEVVRNFYSELLKWPSSYRDYVCVRAEQRAKELVVTERQREAFDAFGWREHRSRRWREGESGLTFDHVRSALFMPRMFHAGSGRPRFAQEYRDSCRSTSDHALLPAAPLRVYRYTVCFNACTVSGGRTRPRDPLFAIGIKSKPATYMSHKVVLMDELHNLVQRSQWAPQLTALKHELRVCSGSVVVGFTGSPVMRRAEDARRLLDVVKGAGAEQLLDEGFVSCFSGRPASVFAAVSPACAVSEGGAVFTLSPACITRVPLTGPALRKYCEKVCEGKTADGLANYCNMAINYARGDLLYPQLLGDGAAAVAPKFDAAARMVLESGRKSLVLVRRSTGLRAFVKLLSKRCAAAGAPAPSALWGASEDGRLTEAEARRRNGELLRRFNDPANVAGDGPGGRIIVADTDLAGEGVSFLQVGLVVLLDVPRSWAALQQSLGRALRMCGHHAAPADQQRLEVRVLLASLPDGLTSFGAWLLSRPSGHWASSALTVAKAVRTALGDDRLGGAVRLRESVAAAATGGGGEVPAADGLLQQSPIALAARYPRFQELLQSMAEDQRWRIHESWGRAMAGDTQSARRLRPHVERLLEKGVFAGARERVKSKEMQDAQRLCQEAARFSAAGLVDADLRSADDELLRRLEEEAAELAPALRGLRESAVDCGMY
eukprot:TRINITY_DN39351_c0_g1_i1.p1 TRINITY_DN39351_c0_g1~~TRINITY_DN39351_c0_g1_i1.p1  ORF type:complete len:930 (+),score=386.90 TRINITY_DN39351_c0_g1_i1:214-2790(+)